MLPSWREPDRREIAGSCLINRNSFSNGGSSASCSQRVSYTPWRVRLRTFMQALSTSAFAISRQVSAHPCFSSMLLSSISLGSCRAYKIGRQEGYLTTAAVQVNTCHGSMSRIVHNMVVAYAVMASKSRPYLAKHKIKRPTVTL